METLIRVFATINLVFIWGALVSYEWPDTLNNQTFKIIAGLMISILFWTWVQNSIRGYGRQRVPDKTVWGWPWRR